MMIVRKHKRFCSQWLAYAFNSKSGQDQVRIVHYGAAQRQFNIGHAVDFEFAFPPLREQQAISQYLDHKRTGIDQLITRTQRSIQLLHEQRSALITAAVTGKIDVREAIS